MKKSLIFALALMLVLAFASSAMAAQVLVSVYQPVQNEGQYLSTTKTGMSLPGTSTNAIIAGVFQKSKFNKDGTTNYPYEIYLPNETNPDAYRIHSNYAKNTDACASCHATHTAVGASLLQWYSTYETCMACHDGTLGTATYNVQDGKIGETGTPAFGGMFGTGNGSESNHNVTGAMEIAAAPGGTTVATEQVKGAHGALETRWVTEFGCESCHSPHGQGGNARILHPDANYAASWAAEKRATPNKYYLNTTNGTVYADPNSPNTPVYIIKGYPYSPAVIDGNTANAAYKINNKSGYSKVVLASDGTTPVTSSTVYVTGVASLQVKMNITNYLLSTETVQHVYGMNFYCGTCHTDYNTAAFTTTGAGAEETGVYAQAHRHQMGMDWYYATPGLKFESTKVAPYAAGSMECLTCHVAHGTSQDFWAATLGGTKGADGTLWSSTATDSSLEELAGSSALKRMPNMGTCEACHAKGEGAEGYNVNAGITLPIPYPQVGTFDPVLSNQWYIGTPIANAKASTWVGSGKCQPCHAEKVAGWMNNKHQTANSIRMGTGCGSFTMDGSILNCHQLGMTAKGLGLQGTSSTPTIANQAASIALNTAAKAAGSTFYAIYGMNALEDHGVDAAVTCEACHGSAATHVAAPSSTNIYNPGRRLQGETAAQAFERENKACGKCHSDREPITDTTTVAQINDGTIHDGPSGYAQSKHFTSGLVGCPDCHDAHANGTENAAITKLEYAQLCSSCHDTANLGSVANVMGGGADHTFSFGIAGATMLPTGSIATITPVKVGQATVASLTYAQIVANATLDRYRATPTLTITNAAATKTYYSFLEGTYTLTSTASAIYGDPVTSPYTFSPSNGRVTFVPKYFTNNVAASNIVGDYKVSYTNILNPFITAPVTTFFTITN